VVSNNFRSFIIDTSNVIQCFSIPGPRNYTMYTGVATSLQYVCDYSIFHTEAHLRA